MDGKKELLSHDIRLLKREKLEIGGVNEVVSFDEVCVLLKTVCGELTIEGKNLKISVLDTEKGVVLLDGYVDALYYSNEQNTEKRGFFGKLFS